MLPDQFSTVCLHVAYRPDLRQLTGRWLRLVSEAELHEGYAALRRAARHHTCGRWLVEARRRATRSANGPEWVVSRFLPEMQRALGQPLRVGFLVLPDYLARLPPNSPPSGPVQFAHFVEGGQPMPGWQPARRRLGN